jgi:hypothetical protein
LDEGCLEGDNDDGGGDVDDGDVDDDDGELRQRDTHSSRVDGGVNLRQQTSVRDDDLDYGEDASFLFPAAPEYPLRVEKERRSHTTGLPPRPKARAATSTSSDPSSLPLATDEDIAALLEAHWPQTQTQPRAATMPQMNPTGQGGGGAQYNDDLDLTLSP